MTSARCGKRGEVEIIFHSITQNLPKWSQEETKHNLKLSSENISSGGVISQYDPKSYKICFYKHYK